MDKVVRHQKQHKDKKDHAKGKEIAELKKLNNQLKRQVARLSKQLSKYEEAQSTKETLEDIEVTLAVDDTPICQNCQLKDVKSVNTPVGTIFSCRSCGWRKLIKE